MGVFQRNYGTGTGADIIIPIPKAGSTDDFAVAADWTPAAGDVKLSKDGGAAANIGTLPVFITSIGWKFVFSDAELTAARVNVNVVDSATKAIKDQHIVIETKGHPSAQEPDAHYWAGINYRRDAENSQDEYRVSWFKNDEPITSGITNPKIKVQQCDADATELIAEDDMDEIGTTEAWYYNEGTNRQTLGESYLVTVTATIDGATRTWREIVGRDV